MTEPGDFEVRKSSIQVRSQGVPDAAKRPFLSYPFLVSSLFFFFFLFTLNSAKGSRGTL